MSVAGAPACEEQRPAALATAPDDIMACGTPCWRLTHLPPGVDDSEGALLGTHHRDRTAAVAAAREVIEEVAGRGSIGRHYLAAVQAVTASVYAGVHQLSVPCWVVCCRHCREALDEDTTLHFETRDQALKFAARDGWVVQGSDGAELVCPDCQRRAENRLSLADDVDVRARARLEERGPGPDQLPLDALDDAS